jgi:UTP--glucose-1-phosphate uridylyltransferase
MKITKAIIPAAGVGTRFFPVTKTIQKEMLPILNRPWIDYVIEDCLKAGIKEIIFVINEHNQQIRQYYTEEPFLKRYLERMHKMDRFELIRDLHTKADFHFVEQKESDQYGTAVPVKLAQPFVEHEDAFLVLMGDDFFYHADGTSETALMIETFEKSEASGLVTYMDVPRELVHKYGIAEYREENGFRYLINQHEKPEPGTINSTLATLSKYIFTPELFKYMEGQQPDARSVEMYITHTYTALAQEHKVVLYSPSGRYLDGGYLLGWLKANLILAKDDPEIREELIKLIEEEVIS